MDSSRLRGSNFIFIFFTAFALIEGEIYTPIHKKGMCAMYGQCGFNNGLTTPSLRGEMSCVNNTAATEVSSIKDPVYYNLIREVCPMLLEEGSRSTKICCDVAQLRTLQRQLVASELLFIRCPSCMENFYSFYCNIVCSPDQSVHVNVTRTYTNEDEPLPGVAEQYVYLSEATAAGFHRSCAGVVFPQTNSEAITLVCNGFTGDDCTPQNMLNYMGSTGNGVAPVDMVFKQIGNGPDSIPTTPSEMGMMDFYTYACNETINNQTSACSCTDCQASCPAPPPLKEPVPRFKIGQADGVTAIVFIVFLVLTFFFIIYVFISYCRSQKTSKSHPKVKPSTSSTAEMVKWSDTDSSNSSCFTDDEGPEISEHDISAFQRFGKMSQDTLKRGFRWWGTFVAKHPILVIIASIVVVVVLCVGVIFIELTTDPVELWTSETSRVRQEKTYYDEHFGAFYRTEMVILKLKPEYEGKGSLYTSYTGLQHNFSEILSKKYLLSLLELQNRLRYMNVSYQLNGEEHIGTLNDICFKPLEPDNNNCTITSMMNYWQNDPNELDKTTNYTDKITNTYYEEIDYRDHFLYCVQAPATIQDTTPLNQNCMGDFGGPIFPFLAVGGQGEVAEINFELPAGYCWHIAFCLIHFNQGKKIVEEYLSQMHNTAQLAQDAPYNYAKALILTFVVNNYAKDDNRTALVKAWEQAFLKIMEEWDPEYFDFAFFSERSPEEELTRSTKTDLIVFIASYVVIFIYITVALGTYTSCRRIPVDSKVSLGLAGILVILSSVFTSIGFLGYVGYSTSLIVIEVVPFLVLAIGADNIFILTLEYQRDKRRPGETLPEHIGRVFGDAAPSMLLCSLTECVTFFLGTLTEMPAIEEFAYAAALAILFDFLLQITAFLAVLSLDARRQEGNRFDILCCFRSSEDGKKSKSFLQIIFQKYYAPFLMNDVVRAIVMVGFLALCSWCTILTSKMTVGLDQDLSVPLDSYVLKYFDYMEKYLDVGTPVYFVTKSPYNFSNPDAGKYICGGAGCDTYSLTQQVTFASQNPEYWKVETPAASWYDDYIDWLPSSGQRSCCRYFPANGSFCPATVDNFCTPCLRDDSYTSEEFMKYLEWFLIDNPGLACNKGGHSAYGNAVSISKNYSGTDLNVIEASYFMAYHSVCIKSVDCTENLVKARELADNITARLKAGNTAENGTLMGNEDDFTVYPYSLYYVYYEQYLTMVKDSFFLIGICLIPAFIFSFVLLGFDIFSGIITTITIIMIVVDTAGLSSIWGVHLNAVSLINLVQAIGLSVEFISHVVHTFSMKTQLSRKDRVIDAMGTMGPAVFAGVALTNLPGIIVLNWATAQLIQVFFFRMCLIITLLGMVHGLVFLPVFLSYFGPPVNKALLYEKQQKRKETRNNSTKMGKTNASYDGDDSMAKYEESSTDEDLSQTNVNVKVTKEDTPVTKL